MPDFYSLRILLLVFIFTLTGFSQLRQDVGDDGYVDWKEATIRMVAKGKPDPGMTPGEFIDRSKEQALANAEAKVRRIIAEIPLNGERTLKSLLDNETFESNLTSFKILDIHYGAGRDGVQLDLELPLETLYDAIREIRKPRPIRGDSVRTNPADLIDTLWIDCRSVEMKPAMMPRILDEAGETLFIAGQFGDSWPIIYMPYQETSDENAALLTVNELSGSYESDLKLDTASAEFIRSALEKNNIVNTLQVIILL
ncbi:MAG: hypothetical protein AAFP70_00290 [Calditrichota bacterium]